LDWLSYVVTETTVLKCSFITLLDLTQCCHQVAHDVSLKTRGEINDRADALDIKVLNRNARMTTEDDE